jgi:hypothetical protein
MTCAQKRRKFGLELLKLWLKAPVEERDGDGKRHMSGGRGNSRGAPQGGVAKYLGACPSSKSVRRIKVKVSDLLVRGNKDPGPGVRQRLNRLLGGWSTDFSFGARVAAYRAVDNHVGDPCPQRPQKTTQGGRARHTSIFQPAYLWRAWSAASSTRPPWAAADSYTMKPVGKPDARNPHVRFDERRRETELWPELKAPALAKAAG